MIHRIQPNIMRSIAEQLAPFGASNSNGINSAGIWVISVLRDGRIAVGCHGARLPPVMLERIIMEFDSLDTKDLVGMS